MKCRHCNRRRPNRPRGLCWSCYYRPGVRDLYPSTSKHAPRQPSSSYREPFHAKGKAEPTDALPGTTEKVCVLTERATAELELFHADDSQR